MTKHNLHMQSTLERCCLGTVRESFFLNATIVLVLIFLSINCALAHESSATDGQSTDEGVMTDRLEKERRSAFNPYVFSTHKQNYVAPISYTSKLNTGEVNQIDGAIDESVDQFLRAEEVKFQLSLKVQLNEHQLLFKDDAIFLGFTLEAWWQLYSTDVSSPFRETNYQPEIFYFIPLSWSPFGTTTSTVVGLEHQSNGQIQGKSRSWNRLYTGLLVEKDNLFAFVRPWYRLPEKAKEAPDSPEGDDNPDILDFMGHGDLLLGLRGDRFEYSLLLRNNFATEKGASELSMSFPMFGRFRGAVQYFNGYGDSLIDYNHFQQRLGFKILLSNLF